MVQLLDGTVISRPIAGTRYRGRTDEEDRRLAAELVEHPKEIAEHIMLVDLARNDVGPGRRVRHRAGRRDDDARALQPRDAPHVAGVGRAGATARAPIDVLRATLPAGTVSGAPKVRAMEIIDDLEPTKRGPVRRRGRLPRLLRQHRHRHRHPHAGASADDGRASVQAGAGIVADSVPEHEDLECRNKARALLAAVPAARRMTARRRAHAGGPATPAG